MSYISNCCGAHVPGDGIDYGLCPECGEHCEIEDEDEPDTPMKSKEDGTIIQFLNGTHSYEGLWFGDMHPTKRGAFWWRKELQAYADQRIPSEQRLVEIMKYELEKETVGWDCDCNILNFEGCATAIIAEMKGETQ